MAKSDLLAAYLSTDYVVDKSRLDISLKVGLCSVELKQLYEQGGRPTAAFISAWAPYSQALSLQANQSAHASLASLLSEHPGVHSVFVGEGRPRSAGWEAEPSFLVLGLSFTEACEIGDQFKQNAILFAGVDAIPRLVWLAAAEL